MSLYTAVTIGPIADTMMLTSSPAGLWGASYLFSWIARSMIQNLVDEGVGEDKFVSPFFTLSKERKVTLPSSDDVDCEALWQEGVGMFHDRIVFCSDELDDPLRLVREARNAAIESLSLSFARSEQLGREANEIECWLNGYLRVYAVQGETPSPLLDLGRKLSALELEPRFSFRGDENLLLRLLEDGGQKKAHNARVKQFLQSDRDKDRWILKGTNGAVRDLEDIAANSKERTGMKYERYYAVLNSDGDSMGEVLAHLNSDDEIREYSQKCLLFCAGAARRMREYGGVPLYAGGDDLLALLPTCGNNDRTIFGLVESLRELFNKTFEDERNRLCGKPSISFGVSIQYYKSPLYEALDQARSLLWEAKGGLKNACYLNLQKHSGQSARLFEERMDIGDGRSNLFASFDNLLRKTSIERVHDGEASRFLSGAGTTVDLFKPLFCQAIERPDQAEDVLKNLYENLFDNSDQRQFDEYLKGLRGLTAQIVQEARNNAAEWQKRRDGHRAEEALNAKLSMDQLQSAIRLLRFMQERGDEDV